MDELYFLSTIGILSSCVAYLYKRVEKLTRESIAAQSRLATAIENVLKKKN